MALYTKINGVWKGVGNSWTPTLSFNANGGTGTMPVYTGFGKFVIPDLGFIRSGFRFLGWNTAPDGSGTTYTIGQEVELTSDITLYAQWLQLFTVTYYKRFNMEYPSLWGPSSLYNGSVTDDNGQYYYLLFAVDGQIVPNLLDSFNNDNYSPTRSITAPKGATTFIQLINKGSQEVCELYINGSRVGDPAHTIMYYFPDGLQSNITVEFEWRSKGTWYSTSDYYWICHVTTT